MVKCGGCGHSVKHARRVVVKERRITHPARFKTNPDGTSTCIDRGGVGTAIVQEKMLCEGCGG